VPAIPGVETHGKQPVRHQQGLRTKEQEYRWYAPVSGSQFHQGGFWGLFSSSSNAFIVLLISVMGNILLSAIDERPVQERGNAHEKKC